MHQQYFVKNMVHNTVEEFGSSRAAFPNTASNLKMPWELAIYKVITFVLLYNSSNWLTIFLGTSANWRISHSDGLSTVPKEDRKLTKAMYVFLLYSRSFLYQLSNCMDLLSSGPTRHEPSLLVVTKGIKVLYCPLEEQHGESLSGNREQSYSAIVITFCFTSFPLVDWHK